MKLTIQILHESFLSIDLFTSWYKPLPYVAQKIIKKVSNLLWYWYIQSVTHSLPNSAEQVELVFWSILLMKQEVQWDIVCSAKNIKNSAGHQSILTTLKLFATLWLLSAIFFLEFSKNYPENQLAWTYTKSNPGLVYKPGVPGFFFFS